MYYAQSGLYPFPKRIYTQPDEETCMINRHRSTIEIWLDQDVLKQAGLVFFFNGTSAQSTRKRDTMNYKSMFSKDDLNDLF